MLYIIISLAVAWAVCFGILIAATWRKQPKQWAEWFPQLVIGLQLALAAVLFIYIVRGGTS